MRQWMSLCLVVFAGAGLALGANAQGAADELRQLHPGASFYSQGDRIASVYGTALGGGQSPESVADEFVLTHSNLFGVSAADLVPGNTFSGQYTQPMMYDAASGTYKFTLVYYHQMKDGIPVYGSDLRLLVRNEPDHPLVLVNSSLHDLGGFQVPAGVTQSIAEQAAIDAALRVEPGLTNFSASELVIWAGLEDEPATPTVAISFVGDNGLPGTSEYKRWRFVADAGTGAILHRWNLILNSVVYGSVCGMGTTSPKADICNPEVSTAMPYAKVTIGTNTAYANASGNFTITYSGPSLMTVQSYIAGLYFVVQNEGGPNTTLSTTVFAPGPANFVHNSTNTSEFNRAEVNGYIQANVIRDWTLIQNPVYPTVWNQTGFPVNVNINDNCNAFYDGASINFFRAVGGCANTSYSNVVHHEYGHHLAETAGSGQGAYGEGLGDSVGMLIADDPVMAYGFEDDCNAGIRTADNTYQYPCSGEIHDCGQLLSGCIWSARNLMAVTYPSTYLQILSSLTVNSILLHTGTNITPQICTDFLVLDDDDADLSNGTPHYSEITAGFAAHNMWFGPVPANDNCAQAIDVCPGNNYSGSTAAANSDGHTYCGNSSGSPDVWHRYRPATNGTLVASLCSGTTYDSTLSIHSGCPGTWTNMLACDDDTCGAPYGASQVSLDVTAGSTYLIRISGYAGAKGTYTLTVDGPACAPPVCRGDGNCDGTVSWRDVDYFVAALDSQATWQNVFLPGTPTCPFDNNDADGDGVVSWRDIDPLVALMNTTCP